MSPLSEVRIIAALRRSCERISLPVLLNAIPWPLLKPSFQLTPRRVFAQCWPGIDEGRVTTELCNGGALGWDYGAWSPGNQSSIPLSPQAFSGKFSLCQVPCHFRNVLKLSAVDLFRCSMCISKHHFRIGLLLESLVMHGSTWKPRLTGSSRGCHDTVQVSPTHPLIVFWEYFDRTAYRNWQNDS